MRTKSMKSLIIAIAVSTALVGCSDKPAASNMSDDHSSHLNKSVDGKWTAVEKSASDPAEVGDAYYLKGSLMENDDKIYLVLDTNLKLTDENYGGAPVPGEGHIHFYLNGVLIGPIQSTEPFEVGNRLHDETATIKIALAENNHREIGVFQELELVKGR